MSLQRPGTLNMAENLVAPPRIELGTHGFSVIFKLLFLLSLFIVIIALILYPFISIYINQWARNGHTRTD